MTLEITQASSLALGKTRGSLCKHSTVSAQGEGSGPQPRAVSYIQSELGSALRSEGCDPGRRSKRIKEIKKERKRV